MSMLTVFYADWEMECCGKPFSVGDEVTWTVMRVDPADPLRPVSADAVTGELYEFTGHGGGARRGERLDRAGRVRRIRVVAQGFLAPGPGEPASHPVPDEFWLRPVDTCPKWFKRDVDGVQPPRRGCAYRRHETGVLVELETPAGS
ncbi:DUF6578 domain-containing protein [Streptomyces palmae]|uniref:Uncharacterized protein n=1 Tax=Streptomyces palmae TaxID=1701085 RepID=A0A4Z0G8Y0_9ACTN|nr:DUF6578 domain-containing protein [Streptomyces palmae]TGA92828.1 hypothetical protein E4099_27065 [Streptomyces palmae]